MRRSALALIGLAWLVSDAATPLAQQARPATGSARLAADLSVLSPTVHPQLPRDLSQLWLAPDRTTPRVRTAAVTAIGNAARFTTDGDFSKALTAVSAPGTRDGALGAYALYFAGVAQLNLKRTSDALASFQALGQQKPVGYLWEAAQLGEAEAREANNEPAAAVAIYQRLLRGRVTDVEGVYMRLGRAAEAAADPTAAGEAYSHVYYEFPLGENAGAAEDALQRLRALPALTPASPRFRADLGRAERLFAARRYGDARSTYEALRAVATDDVADQIQLRLAECDYYTKKLRPAREALLGLASRAPGNGEALYHAGLAARDLGDSATFIKTMQQVDVQFAESTWADAALDSLAAYYVRNDRDDDADALFRRLIERFPYGSHTERAAWKVGWLAYRNGQFDDTARFFERASSTFARSDYRPGWLYWAGRAHERSGRTDLAQDRYALTVTDYAHTYYGRLASKRMDAGAVARLAVAARPATEAPAPLGVMPPNAPTIRALLDAQLFDAATNEVRYAQLVWGDTAVLQATTAWIVQQQSASESGMRRLSMLRAGMNGMRRAYPQFMTSGGDAVPRDVLTVIFPLAYWDLIRKHADANGLDPYFVAALVAQESTFVADVRSSANAVGLMQLMPATARMYAKKLKLAYSQRMLTDPESNIRLGTAYLADKMREFGDAYLALASYNAGERPTHRWQDARPGLDVDEFIDDIPYPETQGYVKKILGTADDYRRIYANAAGRTIVDTIPRSPAVPLPVAAVAAAPAAKAPATASKPASARKPAPRTPARKPAAH
ncbi:MAG: transglycosylase SLT domain-containing protein [Vicinamibacterales bacterium]